MSRQTIAAEAFRKLHEAGTFILPNPGDAGTARLLEQAGFKALGTSSAALAFAMGVPDGEVPRPTVIRHITEIAAATSLPVTADLGDGFGHTPRPSPKPSGLPPKRVPWEVVSRIQAVTR